jgi:transposase-like protein
MVYLRRAVDAEGEVLDVRVQSKRNKHAALKLMRNRPASPHLPYCALWQGAVYLVR